jgi:hypothetical protein
MLAIFFHNGRQQGERTSREIVGGRPPIVNVQAEIRGDKAVAHAQMSIDPLELALAAALPMAGASMVDKRRTH